MLTALESIKGATFRSIAADDRAAVGAARGEHPLVARRNPLTKLADLDGVRVVAVDDDADALRPAG